MPVFLTNPPISENMRKIRLQKGLTQKQVAEACGMVDATYRTYELGKANPKPATVARIAKALGVSVEEIYGLGWVGGPGNQPPGVSSALYQSLLNDSGGALPIDAPNQSRLLAAYGRLNEAGQLEAIKRVEELCEIPGYQLKPGGQSELDFLNTLTEDECISFRAALDWLQGTEKEIKIMREQGHSDSYEAMQMSLREKNLRTKEIINLLLRALERKTESLS